MEYFDGIKKGDKVWSIEYGLGYVHRITPNDSIIVNFPENIKEFYNMDGIKDGAETQTLFWNEVKVGASKSPDINLKEMTYSFYIATKQIYKTLSINDKIAGLARNDIETAEKALIQVRRFTRLLALRDQECPESRGYKYQSNGANYFIVKNPKWKVERASFYEPDKIYFKTLKEAQRICDILNFDMFDLEGE